MSFTTQTHRGFGSDNHATVHPQVLDAIVKVNQGHAAAYAHDEISERARKKFKEIFGPNAQTYFVFNGTAANVLCLRALLHSHEAVICASTAHIAVDECGAPEFHGGHKLITIPSQDGKITPEMIDPYLIRLGDQHYVQPKLVSITQPTELGTVYSMEELRALRDYTLKKDLMLHIDGARFANAVARLGVSFLDMTHLLGIDALSLGGTKNGLLGAEAVVFFKKNIPHFKYIQKQEMQLASKVRFMAAQFLAYFENDLWKEIALKGLHLAEDLAHALKDVPEIQITQKVQSNAVFARIPKSWTQALKETAFFYVWDESDWTVRLMMSHDNTKEDIDRFAQKAMELSLLTR